MANSETLPSNFVPRSRKVRILATLGPASRTPEMIRKLAEAGADAFRVNMSHGTHKDHAQLIETIRALEKELDRPTTILADLQGPKLQGRPVRGRRGRAQATARPSSSTATRRSATAKRVELPHREIFGGVEKGTRLLLDDGKLVQRVVERDARPDRDHGRGRRAALQQQGRQRSRRRASARGSDRQGPRRPRLRARPACRLDRPVLRPAARGRRRGAAADRRARGPARQDREAGRGRPARRHIWSWPTR